MLDQLYTLARIQKRGWGFAQDVFVDLKNASYHVLWGTLLRIALGAWGTVSVAMDYPVSIETESLVHVLGYHSTAYSIDGRSISNKDITDWREESSNKEVATAKYTNTGGLAENCLWHLYHGETNILSETTVRNKK